MLNKIFIKKTAVFVILFFSFFMFQTNFNYTYGEEDILKKARLFINDGNLTDAISELTKIIGRLKNIDDKKKKVAEAYYLLAKVHYDGGDDKKFEENVRMVYKIYPDFNINESNFEIKDRVRKIKSSMKMNPKPERDIVSEKINKKEVNQNEKVKPEEKKIETKKVILKQGIEKKKKKKFPILLVVAGVIAIVAAVVLIGGKKEDSSPFISEPTPEERSAKEVYDSLQWANIPSGDFEMGDNFNEGYSYEQPVHTVYLDSYYIAQFEVTFEQYDKFCEHTGRVFPSDEGWGRGDRPVLNVSWYDAVAFCEWITGKTGNTISLPTEAQWEKAARGTDQRRYPWGNQEPNPQLCNFNNNEGATLTVGYHSDGMSPYGVHDMAGNVREWCTDWYDVDYYTNSPRNNPEGPSSGSDRVIRGGHYLSQALHIRSANRYHRAPDDIRIGNGFRVIRIN